MAKQPKISVAPAVPIARKVPSQVASVQGAGKTLEAGGKVSKLERELHIGGSAYAYEVIAADMSSAMLISLGAIRALRHKGFLKDLVLAVPVEA